jgi:hypothetical protein
MAPLRPARSGQCVPAVELLSLVSLFAPHPEPPASGWRTSNVRPSGPRCSGQRRDSRLRLASAARAGFRWRTALIELEARRSGWEARRPLAVHRHRAGSAQVGSRRRAIVVLGEQPIPSTLGDGARLAVGALRRLGEGARVHTARKTGAVASARTLVCSSTDHRAGGAMPRHTDDERNHLRSELTNDDDIDDDQFDDEFDDDIDDDQFDDEDEEFDDDLPVIDIDADPVNADWIRYNHVYDEEDKAIFEAMTGKNFEEWLEERRKLFESRGVKANMRLLKREEQQNQ